MIVDYIERGSGHTVILLHSTAAGNKQWTKLIEFLCEDYHLVAPNLFGYGATDAWCNEKTQSLEDQAELIRQFIPLDGRTVSIVGHSFGGSVAMMAAKLFRRHIQKLILIEPNPNYLLKEIENEECFNQILTLQIFIQMSTESGRWDEAAARFADFFNGKGTWNNMDTGQQNRFKDALKPNFFEWDAVMNEQTSIHDWRVGLPTNNTVLSCRQTIEPAREIVNLLRCHMTSSTFREYNEGGHMAPLTKPDLINPIIAEELIS